MLFAFALFALSGFHYLANQLALSSEAELQFPEDIQTWCPHTRFCHKEPKHLVPPTIESNPGVKQKACCESCSCSADCGLKRNCCTEELDQYKIDETLGTICKSLNTNQDEDDSVDNYYMVDKCPNKTDTCRMMNVTRFGNFFPVYSRSSGMIYYNVHCANCHNYTDIVEFLPAITCAFLTDQFSQMISGALNEYEMGCTVRFLIPKDIDVSSEVCYKHIYRDCNVDVYQPQYKDFCTRFNATFHSRLHVKRVFQNVYCFLCNRHTQYSAKDWKELFTMCQLTEHERVLSHSSLVVLLDDSFIKLEEGPDIARNPEVCLLTLNETNERACRPVHCPEGHVRVNCICTLIGQKWYVKNIQVFVNLTPSSTQHHKLTIADMKQLFNKSIDSPSKGFIRRAELQDWDVELLYNTNGTDVRYIVAILVQYHILVDTKDLLEKIDRSLQQPWNLNLNDKYFDLRVELNKFSKYDSVDFAGERLLFPTHFVPRSQIVPDGHDTLRLVSNNYFTRSITGTERLLITKMFYCEQVELDLGEFRSFFTRVYIINTKKYLGNGEFTVSAEVDLMPVKIRVCLSDVTVDKNGGEPLTGHEGVRCLILTAALVRVLKLIYRLLRY